MTSRVLSISVAVSERGTAFSGCELGRRTFHRTRESGIARGDKGDVKNSITFVIEVDGTRVGRLRVVRPDGKMHVARIQILPTYQRKGMGRAAMGTIMKEAAEKGLPLTLEVEKDNPDAKRLYLQLGFKVVRERKDRELMELRADA